MSRLLAVFGSHAYLAEFRRFQYWLHRRCHAERHMRRGTTDIDSGYCLDSPIP